MNYKYPQYNRGEIIVWATDKNMNYNVAKALASKVGYEITGEPFDLAFLVKTEAGKELEAGQELVDNYPEFFQSYEREDIRFMDIESRLTLIMESVDGLGEDFEYTDKRKFIKSNKFNANIDSIIDELNDLKIKD